MTNDKECYKRFKKICKKKENEGYVDWKKWVKEQVKYYNEEKMENIRKRYEIKLKFMGDGKRIGVFQMFTQLMTVTIPICTVLVTLTSNFIFAEADVARNLSDNIANLSDNIANKNDIIADIANRLSGILNILKETADSLIILIAIVAILFMIFIYISCFLDNKFYEARDRRKTYYEEIIKVLIEVRNEKYALEM